MLALQLPSSMPHAVPSRQPVTTLPPLACQKLDESISSTSYPRSGSAAKPYLPTLGRTTAAWQAGSLTPPGEMIRPYDRQGVAQLNGDGVQGATDMVARLAGYAGPALPYPAPQNTHYSGSQPSGQRTNPSYQSPTAMAASATASAPCSTNHTQGCSSLATDTTYNCGTANQYATASCGGNKFPLPV